MVKKQESWGDNLVHILVVAAVAMLSVCFLYPLWETVVRSFSSARTANSIGIKLWPTEFTTDAYVYALKNPDILTGLQNTVFRTVTGTLLSVIVTFCGGYALSRTDLPGKRFITFYVVLTMFINAGLIPTYLNIKGLGLLNSPMAWLLPCLTSAWHLIICRNFIASLPAALDESAMIDGAHPLRIVFQIIMPLSAPILAVLTLWNAVGQWNAWFDAMIYTPDGSMTVLQLVVRRMLASSAIDDSSTMMSTTMADLTTTTLKSATIVISTLPIVILYPFLQKHFVKGVMLGAVKG